MILARQYIKRIPADELERQISQAIAVYEAARTGDVKEAESQIRDADFAAETARLTRAQILVQSGTSVLAIANTNPQNVLALLR